MRKLKEVLRLRFGLWTSGELEFVAGIGEQAIRDEVESLKRQTNACLNETGSQGVPWAKWKAASLNRLFFEQGVTGQLGRITAATVQHCERKPAVSPQAENRKQPT